MKRTLVSLTFLLWLGMAAYCHGQNAPTPWPQRAVLPAPPTAAVTEVPSVDGTKIVKQMQARLDRRAQGVKGWSRQASHQLAFSIIVGMLGLIVGLLQGTTKKVAKVLAMGLGFAISAITLFTNKVYLADYHTLQRAVSEASPIIENLNETIANFDYSQARKNQLAVQAEFNTKCGQIDLIGQKLLGVDTSAAQSLKEEGALLGIGVVYAQSQPSAPAWVSAGQRADKVFVYFVGQAENAALMEAKGASLDAAVDGAAHWLRGDRHGPKSPEPTRQLVDLIKQAAQVANTWYSYDPHTRMYKYYTQLRLTNEFRDFDVVGLDPQAELGSGVGPFEFGMTQKQINALFPHPFNSDAPLPVAGEYHTAEVRYYWVPTGQFPPPDSSGSPFKAFHQFQACWGGQSYVAFLFAQNQLVRISVRFFSDCAKRLEDARAFADSYDVPAASGRGDVEFRRNLTKATVEVRGDGNGTSVELFRTGSPER